MQRFDESGYAKSIASIIGSKHNELIINHQDVQDVIPLVPQIYDEPFSDSSQLVTYLLSKFAISDVKVTLSGDGGDELFFGYSKYLKAKKISNIPLKAYLSNVVGMVPRSLIPILGNIFFEKKSYSQTSLDFFKCLLKSENYIEFGAGGSTLYAIENNIKALRFGIAFC